MAIIKIIHKDYVENVIKVAKNVTDQIKMTV